MHGILLVRIVLFISPNGACFNGTLPVIRGARHGWLYAPPEKASGFFQGIRWIHGETDRPTHIYDAF